MKKWQSIDEDIADVLRPRRLNFGHMANHIDMIDYTADNISHCDL